jgi:hypothetical protein
MATDRDEQLRQQRELEEIRRSFAEMGARMGSLFESSDSDDDEPERSQQPTAPAQPAVAPARPRWWWAGALVLLFLAGAALGWVLPRGAGGSDAPPPTGAAPTTSAAPTTTRPAQLRTVPSVPQACIDAADLADEVISKLDRNDRDQRLFSALRDYTIASQACRKEASP